MMLVYIFWIAQRCAQEINMWTIMGTKNLHKSKSSINTKIIDRNRLNVAYPLNELRILNSWVRIYVLGNRYIRNVLLLLHVLPACQIPLHCTFSRVCVWSFFCSSLECVCVHFLCLHQTLFQLVKPSYEEKNTHFKSQNNNVLASETSFS